ncbi:MAG: amidohydrolase family protein [Lachnospiraceae bacterium]|nr:amidohydrolase family protein [Lachnospiraceae bacterium]
MRKRIDGHAHIKPCSLLDKWDEKFGITLKKFGKWETLDGEFARFAMPEYMETSSFSANALIQVLDRNAVERVMVMQSVCLSCNEDMALAVREYPGRIRAAMIVVPEDESCLDEIQYWAGRGLTGIKFEMNPRYGLPYLKPDFRFNSPLAHKICAKAAECGLTIIIDPSRVGSAGYQVEALEELFKDHRDVKFVVCHAGFPLYGIKENPDQYRRWRQMIRLGGGENVWFDLAAIPDLFCEEGYPFCSSFELLKELKDVAGAGSIIWGTDVPGTYSNATYRQMIDMYENSQLFDDRELDDIFYNNASKVYFGDGRFKG